MSLKEDLDRLEAMDMRVEIPSVRTKMFKNLDAALDYCRFAEPESIAIDRIYTGGRGYSEVVGYQLSYTGSKGDR